MKRLIIYISLLILSSHRLEAQEKTREDFIRNFTREHFITWPENNNRKEIFTIAIVNDSTLYKNLLPFYEKKPLFRKKKVKLTYYPNFNSAKGIAVGLIYLNADQGIEMSNAISTVNGKPILIVGENFPYNQSMINLISMDTKIAFEFNKELIEAQGLTPTEELTRLSAKNEIQWNKLLADAQAKIDAEKANALKNQLKLSNANKKLYHANKNIDAKELEISQQNEILDSAQQMLSIHQREIAVQKRENEIKSEEIKAKNKFITVMVIAIVLGIIALFFIYRSFTMSKRANQKLNELNKSLKQHKDEIFHQKILVEEKSKEITDSINYALRIQRSLLPSIKDLNQHFPESFIIFRPKDIVSGDFYWFEKLPQNRILFSVVDCTGHGVPGAFMSLIGIDQLNKIVHENRITSPEQILRDLDFAVRATLHQHNHEDDANDGMEMAICLFDKETNMLHFSGAFNPIWIVSKELTNKELIPYFDKDVDSPNSLALAELPPDKKSVASSYKTDYHFKLHSVKLSKGDCIYVFSDGYADQFGGPDAKKFKKIRFKELLLANYSQSLQNQKNTILSNFEQWKGPIEQIDDVCVMGIRV